MRIHFMQLTIGILVILIVTVLFMNVKSTHILEGINSSNGINDSINFIDDNTDASINAINRELDNVKPNDLVQVNESLHNLMTVVTNTKIFKTYNSDSNLFDSIKHILSIMTIENQKTLLTIVNTFVKFLNDIKYELENSFE